MSRAHRSPVTPQQRVFARSPKGDGEVIIIMIITMVMTIIMTAIAMAMILLKATLITVMIATAIITSTAADAVTMDAMKMAIASPEHYIIMSIMPST